VQTRVAGGWQHVKLQDKRKKKTVLPKLLFFYNEGKIKMGKTPPPGNIVMLGMASRLIVFDF